VCGGVSMAVSISFFFEAEDGIRVFHVTGVQTCALPIYALAGSGRVAALERMLNHPLSAPTDRLVRDLGPFARARSLSSACSSGEIGRASCKERGESTGLSRRCSTAIAPSRTG